MKGPPWFSAIYIVILWMYEKNDLRLFLVFKFALGLSLAEVALHVDACLFAECCFSAVCSTEVVLLVWLGSPIKGVNV